jgi:hypothetical protein
MNQILHTITEVTVVQWIRAGYGKGEIMSSILLLIGIFYVNTFFQKYDC